MTTHHLHRLLATAACFTLGIAGTGIAGAQNLPNAMPKPRHGFTVVAHRGDHTQTPENTLSAYENAIRDGADYVEIDLRTTADSQLVIMHDATVDRMTDGKGLVKDMTYDSLRRLKVCDKIHPQWGSFDIPLFGAVLESCREKIYIYLDFKNADPAAAMREIRRFGMQRQVIVYINSEQQFREWRRVAPEMPLMVSLPRQIKDTAALIGYLDKVRPDVLDGNFDDYTPEMLATARRLGYPVIPDIQGPGESPARWESAAGKGIEGLQSDHPGQLITWLKERSLR